MFPSKTPFLYVLQLLIIATSIMGAMYYGCVVLGQPLALLALLGLKFLPDFPLVPDTSPEQDEETELYHGAEHEDGGAKVGFLE